jgi:hypothetical protein
MNNIKTCFVIGVGMGEPFAHAALLAQKAKLFIMWVPRRRPRAASLALQAPQLPAEWTPLHQC